MRDANKRICESVQRKKKQETRFTSLHNARKEFTWPNKVPLTRDLSGEGKVAKRMGKVLRKSKAGLVTSKFMALNQLLEACFPNIAH